MKEFALSLARQLPHGVKHRLKKHWQLLRGGTADLSRHSFAGGQHPVRPGDALSAEFVKRGPWFSEFNYRGELYGGCNSYRDDCRIRDFFSWASPAGSVLELGSFEGAHSIVLAKHPNITRVVGLDGRDYLIKKSKFVCRAFDVPNVEFHICDFEIDPLRKFGRFDTVFCSGVLYHLTRPWEFIARLAELSDSVFIATHYSPTAETVREGYEGRIAPEFGYFEPLSGLNSYSFWLTLGSLKQAAGRAGLRLIEERTVPHWENGPWVNAYFVRS